MAWTTPKTWSAETLTSNDLNTYLRDNQTFLYDRSENRDVNTLNTGGNYTTSVTSGFVDVDATELARTITTAGGDVRVFFTGTLGLNDNRKVFFNIKVDGADYFGGDGLCALEQPESTATPFWLVSFDCVIEGLSVASHTFVLRWYVTTPMTATLYAGSGTSGSDFRPQFGVQEI